LCKKIGKSLKLFTLNGIGDFIFSSVQFMQPHELQHARPLCPSPTPGVYPNSCPSTAEWIKKMWYTYAMEYYPSIKRKKNRVS